MSSLDRLRAVSGRRVEVRSCSRRAFDDVFITVRADPAAPVEDEVRRAFAALAAVMVERGALAFQEKVYGLCAERAMIDRVRTATYEAHRIDASTPYSFHEGRPIGGSSLAGVQLWGVVSKDGRTAVSTIESGEFRGRLISGPGFGALHVNHLHGLDAAGRLREDPTGQAAAMFERAAAVLASQGFDFRDVVRTWIYSKRLLDWYGGLNSVRTRFFEVHGVGADSGRSFPASTGIQGVTDFEEVSMDVLAMRGTDGQLLTDALHESCRQDRPFEYGSAFSRAMRVSLFGGDSIFVSGTASIERSGSSIYVGNAESQILETLLSIGALLRERGAGLADITSATVFCKTESVLERFDEVARLLGIPAFPYVAVLADVCRPELLVEIEAIAAKSAEGPA
ncbi:MAG: hypothetical protein HY791_30935 [Deltaproteobacteria bacterium]|nr:hypothetical protein [Deltaproteobacteria bacterium]